MKYITALFFTLGSLAMAAEPGVFHGSQKLSNKEFSKLEIHGPALLEKIKANTVAITGSLNADDFAADSVKVFGPASIANSKIKTLEVFGPLSIISSEISGPVKVMGVIEAKDTKFADTLTVAGQENKFKYIEAGKIIVKSPENKTAEAQVVRIKESDVAEVIFDSGKGVVYCDPDSKVGKVSGGTLNKS